MKDLVTAALEAERAIREAQAERNKVVEAAQQLINTVEWVGVQRLGRTYGIGTQSVLEDRIRSVKKALGEG